MSSYVVFCTICSATCAISYQLHCHAKRGQPVNLISQSNNSLWFQEISAVYCKCTMTPWSWEWLDVKCSSTAHQMLRLSMKKIYRTWKQMKKKLPQGFHVLKCQDKSAYIYPQSLNHRARLQARRSVSHVLSHIFQWLETWLMDSILFSTCISDLMIDMDFVLWDTRHSKKNLNVTLTLTLGQ